MPKTDDQAAEALLEKLKVDRKLEELKKECKTLETELKRLQDNAFDTAAKEEEVIKKLCDLADQITRERALRPQQASIVPQNDLRKVDPQFHKDHKELEEMKTKTDDIELDVILQRIECKKYCRDGRSLTASPYGAIGTASNAAENQKFRAAKEKVRVSLMKATMQLEIYYPLWDRWVNDLGTEANRTKYRKASDTLCRLTGGWTWEKSEGSVDHDRRLLKLIYGEPGMAAQF